MVKLDDTLTNLFVDRAGVGMVTGDSEAVRMEEYVYTLNLNIKTYENYLLPINGT